MSISSTLIPLAVLVVAGVIGLALLKSKIDANRNDDATGKFKAKRLFTPNELEFIGRLEAAAPGLRFHGQVSMGAILDPAVPSSDRKAFMSIRGMFAQKIVDFVAQDRATGEIIAIIELDDRTHSSGKDEKRDFMLSGAGYRIIRWNSKNKPSIDSIRAEFFPLPVAVAAHLQQQR